VVSVSRRKPELRSGRDIEFLSLDLLTRKDPALHLSR
jgi:hypothetical protein